jgi:photosynthetic reaction center H subunit
VLLPVPLARLNRREGYIGVKSITGGQFAGVPRLNNPDLVTHLEEEKICAYYGAGTLYATAARAEPLL